MALLQLKTEFTNLKFGNDRPKYGSSGLPYIQTQIPGYVNSPGLFKPIYTTNENNFDSTLLLSLDYPIRGGNSSFKVGQNSFTVSSEIDSIRIRKFLEDAPKGNTFITKQIGLQLSNPKIETGNTLFGSSEALPIPGILENTRVYNKGINTLAQVKVSGTGIHALRHGLVPFALFQKHYYDIVNQQNIFNQKNTNRLLNLNALKMTTGVSPFVNPDNVLNMNLVNTLGISLNRNLLFQYLGGPGSAYGIGSTTITRVVDTTQLGKSFKPLASRNAMVYDQLKSQNVNNYTNGTATTNIQDYYENLVSSINDPKVRSYTLEYYKLKDKLLKDPENKRLQRKWTQLINNKPELVGDPGLYPWAGQTVDRRFYISPGKYQDKLNILKPFVFNNAIAPWEYNKSETDDLIKFVFEAISNDNPDYSTAIFFRAFLTNGITDNNSAVLNPFRYLGRGENFYTYQGFERSISFAFRIAAGSQQELFPLYNKLNNLISQVYPDYSSKTKIMRAPVVRLTIGDYLYRMPGFLESVNVTVDNGYPWEINLDGNSAQLPQVLDVAVSFKPIFSELPRRASANVEFAKQENTIETTYQTTITENNPELIANNGAVITRENQIVSKNSINTSPLTIKNTLSFNAAANARTRAAQEDQYYTDIKQKNI